MSGGPVLNQKGEVIGIHGQGDQEKGIKTGLNLGIPKFQKISLLFQQGFAQF